LAQHLVAEKNVVGDVVLKKQAPLINPRLYLTVAVSRQRVKITQPDPNPQPGRIAYRAFAVAPPKGAFPAEIGFLKSETQAA
jgi:hypothetical protein